MSKLICTRKDKIKDKSKELHTEKARKDFRECANSGEQFPAFVTLTQDNYGNTELSLTLHSVIE
jgi:hypothetical protein